MAWWWRKPHNYQLVLQVNRYALKAPLSAWISNDIALEPCNSVHIEASTTAHEGWHRRCGLWEMN